MSSSINVWGSEEVENMNEENKINDVNDRFEYKPSLSTGIYGCYILKAVVIPPKFSTFVWGKIVITFGNGTNKTFKDCVITTNGTAFEWNWKLDGTRHRPGITVEAINRNNLLDNAVDIVILTKGVNRKLQTKPQTVQHLKNAKKEGKIKEYFILQSNKAVEKYKQLIQQGQKVAGLFHSTC